MNTIHSIFLYTVSVSRHWRVSENKKRYGGDVDFDTRILEEAVRFEIVLGLSINHTFQEYIDELNTIVSAYDERKITLSEKFSRLERLSADIDHMYIRMEGLGLDVIQFAIYELGRKSEYMSEIEPGAKEHFSAALVQYLSDFLAPGWQNSSYRDDTITHIRERVYDMLTTEYAGRLVVHNLPGYFDRLMRIIDKAR